MNVVFVITRADVVGGATVHARDLALGILERGHRVLVLIGGTGEATEELAQAGIPFRSLRWLGRPIHPVKDVLALSEMKRVLAELRPDVVCTHTAKAGLVGRWAAHSLRIPAFYTPHGWPIGDRISTKTAWIFRAAERLSAPYSAGIINVCEAERELARKHRIAPDSTLAMIHNGVHDVSPELRAQPERTPVRLTMVARFERQKDHATLLRALNVLRELPWELELVGDGPLFASMRQLAARLDLEPRVHFVGSARNVAERLAAAQICVLASHFEGFPLSILEGMRAGLPVVATAVGGVREAVIDGQTGCVVPPGDHASLAEALRMLIGDGPLRGRFGRMGRRRYEAHFTFQKMLTRTLALYQSALPESAAGGGDNHELAAAKEGAGGH